jgi:DNA gyrase subunit A
VEGLLASLSQLDTVINILRNAPDGTTAKTSLQNQLNISEMQADAILAMPLRRLTGLERQKLQTEFDELTTRIEQLQRLLGDRNELLKALKKDLRSLKRKYADPRRTKITVKKTTAKNKQPSGAVETKADLSSQVSKVSTQKAGNNKKSQQNSHQPTLPILEPLPVEEETLLEFTHLGYVQRQRFIGEQKSTQLPKKGEDFVVETRITTTQQEIIVITSGGKAYPLKVRDIPPAAGRKHGTSLISLLPESVRSETVVMHMMLPDAQANLNLILLTQQGRIKRLPVAELTNLTARGTTLIKFKDDDQLQYVSLGKTGEQLVLGTSNGRILRFEVNDEQLPIMGRTAQGTQASRLRREHLIGCAVLAADDNLLLVSELGYGKRLPVSAIRKGKRGDIGTSALQFKTATDHLVGMIAQSAAAEVMLVTGDERVISLGLDAVKLLGKDGAGSQIAKLKAEEKIIAVAKLLCI